MRYISSEDKSQIVRVTLHKVSRYLLLLSLIYAFLHKSCLGVDLTLSADPQRPSANGTNLNLGSLRYSEDNRNSETPISLQNALAIPTSRFADIQLRQHSGIYQRQPLRKVVAHSALGRDQTNNNDHREDDALLTDCFKKRDEVLLRQSRLKPTERTSSLNKVANPAVGFHSIRPKLDSTRSTKPMPSNNPTQDSNNFNSEHVPKCRQDGSYDPIQCLSGYCWCVNKFGQPIRNSSAKSSEILKCDPTLYESESNNLLVVAGVSSHHMKNFLNSNGSAFDSSTPNGHINFEATEPTSASQDYADQLTDEPRSKELSIVTNEPVMPLIPNDCKNSRENARNRASTLLNDSIWVPECDNQEERLYAEQQCHKSRVCWCVDRVTGLPLRTKEQLSTRGSTHNCTEIKRILGIGNKPTSSAGSTKPKHSESLQPHINPLVAFYQSSSEYCDTDKRAEFIVSLNNQFRQQISEYIRQNPSVPIPEEFSFNNPFQISELQVSKWKFSIMDRDSDGKIGDREWSKFKNNFKLVDKVSDLDNISKQQKSPYFSLAPLLIVRSQRKCWRDFLDFCDNGTLIDESISLPVWLSCTEVPPKTNQEGQSQGTSSQATALFSENTYALSREAAIKRSRNSNPFLGILKPD